jgi:hypothetical protein
MKALFIPLFFFSILTLSAQKLLELPPNAQPGKTYAQCLFYDTSYVKNWRDEVIPPTGWEPFLLDIRSNYIRFEYEFPIFDTLFLKIPVDQSTRMASFPDQYGLTKIKVLTEPASTKWQIQNKKTPCLSTNSDNCMKLSLVETPAVYKDCQQRVLIATAHQQRFDNLDTVIFKQIIEVKPLKKIRVEVPPQYETVFRKTHAHTFYAEWQEPQCGCFGISTYQIQKALKNTGFYEGLIDDILGPQTKKAILKFQKSKGLPTDGLNEDTFRALGLRTF